MPPHRTGRWICRAGRCGNTADVHVTRSAVGGSIRRVVATAEARPRPAAGRRPRLAVAGAAGRGVAPDARHAAVPARRQRATPRRPAQRSRPPAAPLGRRRGRRLSGRGRRRSVDSASRADRIHELPPAVATAGRPAAARPAAAAGGKVIMCVGNADPAARLPRRHLGRRHSPLPDRRPAPGHRRRRPGPRPAVERFARGINPAGGDRPFPAGPAGRRGPAGSGRRRLGAEPSECGRQVLLEAMAAGRPVVATALPGLAAVVDRR